MTIVLNKYQLLQEIGSGSFSKIYKVKDTYTDNCYAMKIEPKPQGANFSPGLIVREAHLHSRLSDLAAIPKMRWFGQDKHCYYMVLPLLEGTFRNIQYRLNRPNEQAQWTRTAQHMLGALQALHERGYVHRDIKPDNFMLDDAGKLYLIDLGFCKKYLTTGGQHVPPKIRTGGSIIGTANYISVNVHEGKEPSRRDDVESVCYVLWKLCGGLDWGTDTEDDDLATLCDKKQALLQHPGIPTALLRLLHRTRQLDYADEPCYQWS